MPQSEIRSLLRKAVTGLGLPDNIDFKVDAPPRKEMGDFASNIAIVHARKASKNPLTLAQEIIDKLSSAKIIRSIEIAKPGFLNFKLTDAYIQGAVQAIQKQDHAWGKSRGGEGKKVLLEFVSANPTGPLHIGHGRWAVIGDVIGRLLSAVGCKVEEEFYINNIGNQVDKLYASVKAVREGKEIPEGGYGGAYVKDVLGETQDEMIAFLLNQQKETLSALGVKYDRYFPESDLHKQNKVKMAVEKLHANRKTFEEDGAIWFKSQEMGDDKNRVLMRTDGSPTYFAADIAYHLDKFTRGYDLLIDIWGTDHHGYVNRLKSALAALGLPAEKLEIIIGQLVTLYRGDELVRMSKRTGEMVTLQEVIDEIGADAVRFFFSATDVNSHLDFDLELAKKRSHENPVYYVQYAHARICSILKKAESGESLDFARDKQKAEHEIELSELKHPAERKLMLKLLSWPDLVEEAARLRHPHRITEYGKELATVFHSFYEKCRVLGDPARLYLVDASRIVLRNVLELLGISALEEM